MKLGKTLLATAAAAVLSLGLASQASADTIVWANKVHDDTDRGTIIGAPATDGRFDSGKALFAPQSSNYTGGVANFYSLGLGGSLVVKFDPAPLNAASATGIVIESTYNTQGQSVGSYVETATVEFSSDAITWSSAFAISNTENPGGISRWVPSAINPIRYIRITDTTDGGPSTDGFDVNAVGIKFANTPAFVPLPSAAWAGLGLLGVMGGLKLRKSQK